MQNRLPVTAGEGQGFPALVRAVQRLMAQDLLTERLGQVSRGELVTRERRPARVQDLFLALEEHTKVNRRKSLKDLRGRWRHLRPVFAFVFAAKLTTDSITRYARLRQEEGAANATINRELAVLRRALNLGRRSTPPKVREVPYIPMLKEDNVRRGFVEDGEFSRLTAEAHELWLRTLLELAYTYGWRRGELLGLRVRQLSWMARTIRLDVGSTKNREGREVAMTAKVEELLHLLTEGKRPDDLVFTREDGKPVKRFSENLAESLRPSRSRFVRLPRLPTGSAIRWQVPSVWRL